MFIERSAAKIRRVRILFVLVGFLPCAVLVGWATVRHSAAHRDAMRREAERALGLPVVIGSVDHVRPGAMRLRDCALVGPAGTSLLVLSELELEATADEVRLRTSAARCSPGALVALARIGRAWLGEPVRFPRAWIVEVDAWQWDVGGDGWQANEASMGAPGSRRFPLRIECVAAGDARAVRVVRGTGDGTGDEIRVIATAGTPCRYEVRAALREPVPWAVIRAILPPALAVGLPLGPAAALTGRLDAASSSDHWSGSADGLVEGIDLEELSAGRPYRLEGVLAAAVRRLEWNDGRLEALELTGSAGRGRIAQSLLGAMVSGWGCRPGPAFRSLAGEAMRPFDDLAVTMALGADRLTLLAGPNRGGAIARRQGLSLIDEPAAPIPLERVAPMLGGEAGGILTRF